ncbi:hypothetical protein COCON_G00185170 [Conger conger]|uniref:CLOCK-interacting pacemaker n=1 Tax=Conger conger TaxID=82655 RepID=A0A9Q1D2I3_CONCO|nr:hypothetical protein COCON_G00185170 [Conger conger]
MNGRATLAPGSYQAERTCIGRGKAAFRDPTPVKSPRMPKEQACTLERAGRSSSKNAKDKSNSAALLASRGRAGREEEARGRASQCSSEKDSGYSDAGSDSLDDQRSSVSEPQRRGGGGAGTPLPCPGELTPIYIIKNLVLKQPLAVQSGSEQLLPGQLTWGGGAGHSSQGPAQLLFIQQPGPAPLRVPKPPSRSGGERGGNKNSKGTILSSYPRIAPHPGKKSPEPGKGSSEAGVGEGQSLSKRVCVEERREAVSTTSQMHKHHHHHHHHHPKQQEGRPHAHPRAPASTSAQAQHRPHRAQTPPGHCPSVSSSPGPRRSAGSPSVSSSQAAGAPGSPGRQRRFLNTVEILSQSGLLDATLRTQELLRQSAATERDIAQLRRHAQLLCRAARAGPRAPEACGRLLRAMARSGCYPALSGLATGPGLRPEGEEAVAVAGAGGNSAANGKSSPVAALADRDNEAAPPSPLLAPTPDPPLDYLEEVLQVPPSHGLAPRDHWAKSPPDIIMPPDSSTSGCLL